MGTIAKRLPDSKTEAFGRMGLAAKGAVWMLVALLLLLLVIDSNGTGKATGQKGALSTIADNPAGLVLLVLIGVGLAGYALWRLSAAFQDRENEGEDAKGVGKRIGYAIEAIIYLSLAAFAFSQAFGTGILGTSSGGGSGGPRGATSGILGMPGGRFIVGAIGVIILLVGLYNIFKGVSRRFMDDMEESRMEGREEPVVKAIGVIGLTASGVVTGIMGWFLIRAAIESDSSEAVGLDGVLSRILAQPVGTALALVMALGLLAFAAYCFAQAAYEDV